MGRDWYWGGGKSSSPATTAATNTAKRDRHTSHTASTSSASGCISAIFHFFDFQHFQFPLHHQSPAATTSISQKSNPFLPQELTSVKGIETPRNGLESEEEEEIRSSTSLLSTSKDEILNIPSIGIQIKTSGNTRAKVEAPNNDLSSEISSSPATKTPTLVARLMGLDLLPDCSHLPSASSTPKSLHHNAQCRKTLPTKHRNSLDGDIRGTRSLPETPRLSAARRSDVDLYHRLSLQINKENMSPSEELVLSRLASLKRKEQKTEDENRTPGHYSRQTVKQVKENVSRKVGMDITNTVRNREATREELVIQFKAKKISNASAKVSEHSMPSCSPRLRLLEPKSKLAVLASLPQKPPSLELQPQSIRPSPVKSKLQPVQEEQRPSKKCKKSSGKRFSARLKKLVPEEPFVRPSTVTTPDKKCKKTPLSNNLLLNISVPTLLPVKKDPSSSLATKFSQKQVSEAQTSKQNTLCSRSSQTYKQQETYPHPSRGGNGDRCNGATASTSGVDGAEHEYITRILIRTGIDQDTPVSFTRWFSPSHPLNPSIFYYLEHFTVIPAAVPSKSSTSLHHRCNRKLLFHLVDEILVEILKTFFNTKPWVRSTSTRTVRHMRGSELIETLCYKIRSFPRANCRVLEDIDALIERDFLEMKLQRAVSYEEEGEGIAAEVERQILDDLVHEMAVELRGRNGAV
ncbi:hypothetical protein SLA2020_104290 [Shorea laevis]